MHSPVGGESRQLRHVRQRGMRTRGCGNIDRLPEAVGGGLGQQLVEAEAKIMTYTCPNATRFYSVVRAVTGGARWRRASADVLGVADGRRRTETEVARRARLSISAVGSLGRILSEVSPFWRNCAGW